MTIPRHRYTMRSRDRRTKKYRELHEQLAIWTESLDAIALQRWNDGESAGMIAKAHGLTRNQVIGRLNRMGAPKRAVPLTRIKLSPGPKRPPNYARAFNPDLAEVSEPVPPIPEILEPLLIDGKPITIRTCSDKTCRWIFGAPSIDAPMCGRSPKPGSPYCPDHSKKSFQPQHDQTRRHLQAEKAAEAAAS